MNHTSPRHAHTIARGAHTEGFVFVMGDNRGASNDSRYEFGVVPLQDIIGRAWLRYWPFNVVGIIIH